MKNNFPIKQKNPIQIKNNLKENIFPIKSQFDQTANVFAIPGFSVRYVHEIEEGFNI